MKSGMVAGVVLAGVAMAAPARVEKLQAVPFTAVEIHDRFWAPKQETNRVSSIAVNLDMLEKAGNIRNFERAAQGVHEGYEGPVFMDSDLYKGLEAASYSLATHPDPALAARLDAIIAKIAAAQQPDGYLNTHFQVVAPDKKWSNLRDWHELYCAGHLFEGAVAHFQATGKRNFLDVAVKLANHIESVFGTGSGKRMGYPGHPEIELALVKLSRATGETRYFELARFFVENRGRRFFATEHGTPLDQYDGAYWQDDVPICDHKNIKGHAVRAAYLLSGVVDVAGRTGDERLLQMVDRVWRNTVLRNTYLTGGIGPSAHNEGFTSDYDLPNLTAYQETCASVAMSLWNHRLALLYGDSKYADALERALYNGVISGVSHDGRRFFYVNPLESRGDHHRSEWFGCACCPPNVARTLASLGGYVYAASPSALWVNLYVQGTASVELGGQPCHVSVTTDYPWDGRVVLRPTPASPATFEVRLRIPGWCQGATAKVNGKAPREVTMDRGYLVLKREWRKNDRVELLLPMPVERMVAHPRVAADTGLTALQRGPLVYCVEAADNPVDLGRVALPLTTPLEVEKAPWLGGVITVKAAALETPELGWRGKLYQSAPRPRPVTLTAIPYYAWDNRKAGPMQVWLPQVPPPPPAGGPEMEAKVAVSFKSSNAQPEGIHDGLEPKSSGEQPAALCHWWPHKGTAEWVQYTWATPVAVAGVEVYWFDDTGRGECRYPESARVEYRDGETWKPVAAACDLPVLADKWCRLEFAPLSTTALRVAVKMKDGWAAGIHEWRVLEAD